jgi:hypothetical protein
MLIDRFRLNAVPQGNLGSLHHPGSDFTGIVRHSASNFLMTVVKSKGVQHRFRACARNKGEAIERLGRRSGRRRICDG